MSLVNSTVDIAARAAGIIEAAEDPRVAAGVAALRNALCLGSQTQISYLTVQPAAQAIINANSDPQFQRGVALLAWACGVKDLQPNRQPAPVVVIEAPQPDPQPELIHDRYRILANLEQGWGH